MKKPDYYEKSNPDDPIGFFGQFFTNNGFKYFREEFYTEEYQDDSENWHFHDHSKKNMSIDDEYIIVTSFVDFQVGPDEWIQEKTKPYRVYFKNVLRDKLNDEFESSKRYFTEKIDSFENDLEKIKSYLKVSLNSLMYIINVVKSNPEINKFQINLSILYQTVDFLFKRFNVFLSSAEYPIHKEAESFILKEKSDTIPEAKDSDKINEGIITKKQKYPIPVTGFKWKINPAENTLKLHDFLMEECVIQKGVEETFKEAFGGEILKEPLKIRWLKTTNRKDIKPVIIKIIHVLMDESELGLLKKIKVQAQLARTIENIFVDPKGQPISGTAVTISQMKQSKGIKADMTTEALLKELRAVDFNAK